MRTPRLLSLVLLLLKSSASANQPLNKPMQLFVVGSNSPSGGKLPPMHVRTLTEARDAIRALPTSARARGIVVNVAPGSHYAAHPDHAAVLALECDDSGFDTKSPIVWRGQTDATGTPPRITSSIKIPAAAWEAAGRSPHGYAVYKANLFALGLRNLSDAFNTNQGQCGNDGRRSELFFAGKPMMLGRHPNAGVDGTWHWLRQGAAVAKSTSKFFAYSNTPPNRCADAGYPGCDQPWVNASRLYVHGFWHFDWSDVYERVAIERASTSAGPNLIYSLDETPHYGLQPGSRYMVLNSLSITDAPGEFFVDVLNGFVFFIPPEDSESWAEEEIVMSTGLDLVTLNGTRHLQFQNLVFEYVRRDGLTAVNVSDVHIANCTVANTGANGISIEGQHSSFRSSTVRDVGCSAVTVFGGDIQTLTPSGLVIDNNDIFRYGRISRSGSPGIGWGGVGVLVRSNEIHHAPHTGIMHLGGTQAFGAELSAASANSLFAGNFLHDLCQGTSDAGAFYSGRSWAHRGNRIVNNTFARIFPVETLHETESPTPAIYLDDMEAGWLIESNLFKSLAQGVYLNGGRENMIVANTFMNCSVGVGWAVHRPCTNNSAETACFGGFLKQLDRLHWLTPPMVTKFHINVKTEPCNPALNRVNDNRYCHPTGSSFVRGWDNFTHLICGTRLCPHEPGHAGVIFRGPASWNSTFVNNTSFEC